jgi:hypothetical protein
MIGMLVRHGYRYDPEAGTSSIGARGPVHYFSSRGGVNLTVADFKSGRIRSVTCVSLQGH